MNSVEERKQKIDNKNTTIEYLFASWTMAAMKIKREKKETKHMYTYPQIQWNVAWRRWMHHKPKSAYTYIILIVLAN